MSKQQDGHSGGTVAPRRGFFRLVFSEAVGLVEEVRGKPQMRLSELDKVPDHILRQMIPMFNEQSLYQIKNDRLLLKQKQTGTSQEIYRFTEQELFILHRFGKQGNLEMIGRRVAKTFGMEEEVAYQQVKSLFLMLAKRGIYIPTQAYDFNEEPKE